MDDFYKIDTLDSLPFLLTGSVYAAVPQVKIILGEKVLPDILQKAIVKTQKRYKLLQVKYVETKKYTGYVDNNADIMLLNVPFHQKITVGKPTNDYPWVFSYDENTIVFTFFHGLFDGRASVEIVKTALFYYFSQLGVEIDASPYVKTLNDAELCSLMERETETAFKNRKQLHCEPLPEKATVKGDVIDKKYLTDTHVSYLLRMDAAKLLAACKRLETTPFSILNLLLVKSLCEFTEKKNPVLKFGVAADVRKILGTETLKNCVMQIPMNYDAAKMEKLSLETAVTMYRSILDVKLNYDNVIATVKQNVGFMDFVEKIKVKWLRKIIKNNVISVCFGTDFTFFSSYLGKTELPQAISERVLDVEFYQINPFSPLEIIAHGYRERIDIFFIDNLNTHKYLDNFIGMLDLLGCSYDMQELGEYKACTYEI